MLASVVSTLLLAGILPALRVEITSPKTELLAFEPVKVIVRATALQPVLVPSRVDTSGYPLLETWIDYGQGFVRYVDDNGDAHDGVEGDRTRLEVGEHFVKTLVLVNGPMDRPNVPFPNPGQFPLRVVVRSPEGVLLGESNELSFDIVAPQGDDAAVVQRIEDQPWVLRGGLPAPTYAALAGEYPASPYLFWGKLAIALAKGHRIHNGRYPDTNEKFADISQGNPLAAQLYRQLADELREARWGQFDEERLQLAAENLERAGNSGEAKEVWQEILDRFPGSEAAEQATNRIDTTPPSLQLTASPSALWPPNHKLVAVATTITVRDEVDPNPSVVLESITCNDACNPTSDIADAAYGTDDRQFQLRAERSGGGTGRAYTITYLATDASGNRATASATVVVPHDQSGKN